MAGLALGRKFEEAVSSEDEEVGLVAARKRVRHTSVPGGNATVALLPSNRSDAKGVGVADTTLARWDLRRVRTL